MAIAIQLAVTPGVQAQEDESYAMEEIVVTARKRLESIQDVPITVSAFNADALKQMQINDVTDLQSAVSNVYIAETGGLTSGSTNASIRGVGSPFGGSFEPSVAIYIDDTYILGESGQFVNLLDVAQVEVLKGPQGTLYGRNTTAGAIKFTSQKPSDEFGGSIETQFGSDGMLGIKASVTGPITETLSGLITISHKERDGLQEDVNTGEEYWTEDLGGARIALAWDPTDDLSVNFSYSHIENDSVSRVPTQIYSVLTREEQLQIAEASNFILPSGLEAYEFLPIDRSTDAQHSNEDHVSTDVDPGRFNVESKLANLVVDYEINDLWSVKSITSSYRSETIRNTEVDGTAHGYVATTSGPQDKQFSQELQLSYSSDNLNVIAGLYYFDHENNPSVQDALLTTSLFNNLTVAGVRDAFTGILGSQPSVEDTLNQWLPLAGQELNPGMIILEESLEAKSELESKAAFVNIEWDITEQLTLNIGGRYTEEEKESINIDKNTNILAALFVDGLGNQYWYDDRISGATEAMTAQLGAPLFTQSVMHLDDGVQVIDEEGEWSSFDYLVGLSYSIPDLGMVYGSVSTSFKSGGFNGIPDSDTSNFDEETLTAYAIGFKSTLMNGRMLFNIEWFRNEIDDVQFRNFIVLENEDGSLDLEAVVGNFGAAVTEGVDMTIGYAFTQDWRMDLNLSYLDAEVKESMEQQEVDGEFVAVDVAEFMKTGRAPQWSGNISTRYQLPLDAIGGVELFLQYAYTDETPATQPWDSREASLRNAISDSHGIWNAQVTWVSQDEQWRVYAAGKNLNNKRVLTDAVDLGLGMVTGGYNSPRSWSVGVDYSW
ncbi:TonB-dependent receptor [Pseudomaricurvus alkylphenolicus]|uniref:TonB-dependent receptor n=1 Tax=Pseudomaricurvus alkylphenolicus TaxID=1306991 RepID=UPI001420D4FC|nr:TonB-dependent receptor [Pseudomaricurvus alkylphenolicus]NIB37979.1 TonB-dependent receptor [Pseudomaricurvus alkylphenolicus]